ncbi:mycofactocin-coupled SDR family oxidoreductase [Cryptosporangium phraense]|uniref:NAD(P)-dependent oxidoreductase n=1 Tax=Cryptosporangium phraense TaxID=2593070 RepID=A0A545AGC1_9ACTN|nr:mycofactocin-coupled SDR family oxidoreductase [Cryptosporangium phraense]TQS40351.1 NAD(P)-dependent oxidoreductase [Cryptosporangium phraense]
MAGRFEGKVLFVTGAARGQGRNHAIRFAQEGADVIAVDIAHDIETVGYPGATKADLDETVRAVEAQDRRIVASTVDIRDRAALIAAVDEGVAQLGRVDVVSSNAGIATFAPAAEMTEEMWRTMIDINLTGQFFTAQAAIPHLVRQGDGGSIAFTSSTAGLKGMSNLAHYSAAKHGLIGLARSLANELAPHKIRVNTIHPTNVDTMMIQNSATKALFGGPDISREEFGEAAVGMNMLPVPWVDVDDISEALMYLASDAGRFLTGVALPVDAGMSQK